MQFDLTEEQAMLADSLSRTAARSTDAQALFDLGAGAALLTEAEGGFGGTGADIMTVFATLGRAGAVTPLLDRVVLGAAILAAAGKPDLAEAAAAGTLRLATALRPMGARLAAPAPVTAEGERLTGTLPLVADGTEAEQLIVEAGGQLWLVAAEEGLSRRSYGLMDGGNAAEVTLDAAPATLLGDAALADRPRAAAILATCAEALGAMERAADLTVEYLKTRKQFGRPIGSFQALQHRMADLVTEVEQARSAVWNLAVNLDTPERDRHVAASKALVGRIACMVAEEAIQLHGGIGMTEEYELAPLARRLLACDARFGDHLYHLGAFARLAS